MLPLRPYQQEALDKIAEAEDRGVQRMIVAHATGTGKSQPDDEPVLTPYGWRKIGELSPGDLVTGSGGKPVMVTGVFPQGPRPTVIVRFTDGTEVRCDTGHLWQVQTRYMKHNAKRYGHAPWRILTAHQLAESGQEWFVPVPGAVEFRRATSELPIEPYTLGVLLGDGGLSVKSQVRVHARHDLIPLLSLPAGHSAKLFRDQGVMGNYLITSGSKGRHNEVLNALRELRLHGHTAHGKFIPETYLRAAPADRLALLQGLLDTDGSASGNGSDYTSVSYSLAEGVAELARSLGGRATVSLKQTSWTTGHLGSEKKCGEAYRVYVTLPRGISPFRCDRKRSDRLGGQQFDPVKKIESVTPGPILECTCISVDAPDQLYVTTGYAVTHNTVTFSHLIRGRPGRAIVLCHRDELITQAAGKIAAIAPELSTGIVKAEIDQRDADVVIASVQSLHDRRLRDFPRDFATVIVDEAHHSISTTWRHAMWYLRCFEDPGPLTVGFTATPGRGDGRALSAVWQEIVHEFSLLSGIVGGYLCDVRGQIAGTSMDLSNVRQVAGDYSASWLAREMERSEAIPQIADAWVKHGQGRKTLAFTPDVATAHELAAALRERGVAAEAADGSTDAGIRRDILARFKRGETQVAVNCGLWTEGFDEPSVACVLIARPTRSKVLFSQMAGRGTRPYPGKQDLLLLDVTGISAHHDLQTVSSLAGLPEKSRADNGQSVLEALEEIAEGGKDLTLTLAETEAAVSMFRSKMRWMPVAGGGYVLPAEGGEIVLFEVPGTEGWTVTQAGKGTRAQGLTLGYAQGFGEDIARASSGSLSIRNASWLRRPPTGTQLAKLRSLGIRDLTSIRTRGDAADRLTQLRARSVIANAARRQRSQQRSQQRQMQGRG